MLYHDAGLSVLHFVFVFLVVGTLSAEAFLLRLPVDGRIARLLLRIDMFYAIGAVGVILAGVARVFLGAKGASFYGAEPFFWAKMATFGVIGLISIGPTRAFMRWTKAARDNPAFAVDDAEISKVRRFVMAEVHLLALVIVFAALMARGLGAAM